MSNNEEIDDSDELLLMMTLSGVQMWKSSQLLTSTIQSVSDVTDTVTNQIDFQFDALDLKYCGNPFIGMRIRKVGQNQEFEVFDKDMFIMV